MSQRLDELELEYCNRVLKRNEFVMVPGMVNDYVITHDDRPPMHLTANMALAFCTGLVLGNSVVV